MKICLWWEVSLINFSVYSEWIFRVFFFHRQISNKFIKTSEMSGILTQEVFVVVILLMICLLAALVIEKKKVHKFTL
jgi:hypothetical protein